MELKIVTAKKINKKQSTKKIIKRQSWINLMIDKESKLKWLRLLPNSIIIKFNNKICIKNRKPASLKMPTQEISQWGKVQGTVLQWISTCPLSRLKALQLLKILISEKAQNSSCLKWSNPLQEKILTSNNKALKALQSSILMNKIPISDLFSNLTYKRSQ